MGQYKSLYDFYAKTIDEKDFDFSSLKGKKVMIVNTASKCSLTPQYAILEELHQAYGHKLAIIAFPANNFMGQEKGTNEEIFEFCTTKYDVTFQLMEKISVKGKNQHPIYKWLTNSKENGVLDTRVRWNFQKFLVDEQGHVVDFVRPMMKPNNERVISWIEEG